MHSWNDAGEKKKGATQDAVDVWNSLSEFMVPGPRTNIFKKEHPNMNAI